MAFRSFLAVVLGVWASAGDLALARAPSPPLAETGRLIAQRDCGACHAIGARDRSRFAAAPAFRDLHKRYDVEGLAEALAEGIMVGHPAMPARAYEPDQIRALITHLKSLEPRNASPRGRH